MLPQRYQQSASSGGFLAPGAARLRRLDDEDAGGADGEQAVTCALFALLLEPRTRDGLALGHEALELDADAAELGLLVRQVRLDGAQAPQLLLVQLLALQQLAERPTTGVLFVCCIRAYETLG